MKKFLSIIFVQAVLFIGASYLFTGCYTDTIDSFSKIKIQLPLFFHSHFHDKASPDNDTSFTNLYQYKEYEDNKDKIDKAEIYQFNYRIDSLMFATDKVKPLEKDSTFAFDPLNQNHEIEFEYIQFYIHYAVKKPGWTHTGIRDLDSSHWKPDPNAEPTLLGEFRNVKVRDYYRLSRNIQKVEERVTEIITEIAKNRPQFYVITVYSKTKGQTQPKQFFPLIYAYYDLFLRMHVSL